MSPLAEQLKLAIGKRPQQFSELADAHRNVPWREFLRAWGDLRASDVLKRDDEGNYCL